MQQPITLLLFWYRFEQIHNCTVKFFTSCIATWVAWHGSRLFYTVHDIQVFHYFVLKAPSLVDMYSCGNTIHIDFTLAIADVWSFSPAVTCLYTSLRIGYFCCSSFISSGVTFPKMETTFSVLTISSLSYSSTIDCLTKLIPCAFCLRSSGILELLRNWSTASQTDE